MASRPQSPSRGSYSRSGSMPSSVGPGVCGSMGLGGGSVASVASGMSWSSMGPGVDPREVPGSRYFEDPGDPRVQERNRNRKLLADLNEKHNKFVGECEGELTKMRTAFTGMRGTWMEEHEQVKHELLQVGQQKAALEREVGDMRSEMQRMTQEYQQLMSHARDQASTLGAMQSEFRQLMNQTRDQSSTLVAMKREFQQMTGKISEHEKHTTELRKGLHSKDEIVRLESKTGLVMNNLQMLTRQLLDRGVLMPPKPEEPPEADKPPVGTIELDEDVFTARLMLKLGFMRADAEGRSRTETNSDWDSDREELMELSHFDNVQGLMVPEVEQGDAGYFAATTGWLGVCVLTSFIQWLILAIMLTHGLHSDECFHHPPTPFKWWLLHLSKALAMCITGIMMGKELMGILNYFLVSELLEPKRSLEVMATTLAQGGLTLLLVAANVFVFLGLTNPVDVWTNMAALGFIANLDAEVLEVAKGGILGHHMQKNLTPLNYQLTFVSHYPTWFGYVRGLAVIVVATFISCFAAVVFLMPDPVCSAM